MHRQYLPALAAAASVIALAVPAVGAETVAPTASSVSEVVVTANKRAEKQGDVPMSVTALPGEALDKLQDRSFADYAALVPGLTLTPVQPGQSTLTLRGLNAGGDASTVSVYVDESPFGSSSGLVNGATLAADFDTFDVQRIEVLRGPQGTLYGANSEGGLIKFVTNPPEPGVLAGKLEIGGESVSDGNTTGSAQGIVNAPIGSDAAIRLTGFYRTLPGWIDDPLLGQRNVNRGSEYGGRASFLLKANEDVTIRLTASSQDIRNRGTPEVDVDPVSFAPIHGDLAQERFTAEPSHFSYQNYNATINWNLHWANLTSTTTYGRQDVRQRVDETSLVFTPPTTTLGDLLSSIFGEPLGAYLDSQVNDSKFTQELRLTSPAQRLEWQVGGFYTTEEGVIAQTLDAFKTPSGAPSGLADLELVTLTSTYREVAGFASATYHFTPTFDVQAGGRYSHNSQEGTEVASGLLVGPVQMFSVPSSGNVFNYSVAPRWHLSPSTMLYARVSSGYRPGGPNVLPPAAPPDTPRTYRSDSTVNYEAGVKSNLLDGRLALDVAAFLVDWKNIQLLESVNHFGINGNGGAARSEGLEWDVTLIPVHGLTLAVTGAYTDAKLTQDAPGVGGLSGDQLPFTPKLSATFDGEYDWAFFSETTAFVGATWSYAGDRTSNFSVPPAPPLPPQPRFVTLPSYDTINLRAGLDYRRWRVQVFAKNVGDSRGIVNITGPGSVPDLGRSATIIQPRSVGVALSAKF